MRIAPQPFAEGMALQLAKRAEALAGGMPRRGWKIGINVPEVLEQLALPHPGLGWLDGRRVLGSGTRFEPAPDSQLHLEPEVAIRIASRVPEGCSADSARSRIESVHPALEIVDYARPTAGLTDVISHSMFHEATVLGDPVPITPDLGVLVAFAADFLAAFDQTLDAGDLLLSGAYLPRALAISAGDSAVAEYGPMGAVSIHVAD